MGPEDAAYFDKTLELGRELSRSLPDDDILGRWMAHYISELITRDEAAPGDGAEGVRRETAEAIIELWRHRADIPTRNRPMSSFDPVLKALERLSGPQEPWGFYGMFTDGSEPSEAEFSIIPLLRCALDLEDTVRDVVRQIIVFAAASASDREAKWVKGSEHLAADDASRAIKELLKLAHEYSGEAPSSTLDEDSPAHEGAELVDALCTAEQEIRRVRLELARVLADGTETGQAER